MNRALRALITRYVDDCAAAAWQLPGGLNPAYHPTADGAVKMIPHHGDTRRAAAITTALTALQNLIASLNSGQDTLSPATLQALQAAQSAVDTVTATATADVTSDTPPTSTPPAS
jgi:hypothetical protein